MLSLFIDRETQTWRVVELVTNDRACNGGGGAEQGEAS